MAATADKFFSLSLMSMSGRANMYHRALKRTPLPYKSSPKTRHYVPSYIFILGDIKM
jgi:hypothetical protein